MGSRFVVITLRVENNSMSDSRLERKFADEAKQALASSLSARLLDRLLRRLFGKRWRLTYLEKVSVLEEKPLAIVTPNPRRISPDE